MVNSVGQVGLPPINANTLGYQGSMLPYVPIVTASRDPTGTDINYPTGCEWSNGLTLDGWKLFGFVDGVAQWRTVNGGGGGSGIQSLSDDFGTKAFPDGMGDVQLLASPGIATLAGATSINFSLVGGGVASQYYNVDAATVPGVNPVVPDGGGNVNLTGGQVAPGSVGADVIETHTYNPHSITFEIQQTNTAAAKDTTKNGVSHFNNAQFTADQGFISLVGGSVHPAFAGVDVDAHTAPGTDPVVADGSGIITVTGDQAGAGTCGPNVIRTDSLAPNTISIEIQRTAAVAAPDSSNNGVSHFDSAFFNVDSAGFVQLATSTSGVTSVEVDSFVGPGTNPVVPDIMGQITVNGLLAPSGTTPIQSISLAANEYAIEVQTSQQAPTTDVSKNGMSHFYSDDFLVDANGFVTLKRPFPSGGGVVQQVRTLINTVVGTGGQYDHNNGIPTVFGGGPFMTLTITPTSPTSVLVVEHSAMYGTSYGSYVVWALFRDSDVNSSYSQASFVELGGATFSFIYYTTSGTTSPVTFALRAGPDRGALYMNADGIGLHTLGGTTVATMFITEYSS